jgi:hypothetical protein
MAKRIGKIPVPGQPLPTATLCNATLCTGFPWTLNPSPILAPSVDTLYSGGWVDLAQTLILNVPDASRDPDGARYLVMTFYDMYANVPFTIGTQNYPHGGRFCLIWNPAQRAICNAVPGGVTAIVQLPRYGAIIGRVYSLGNPVSCIDPQTGVVQPGLDGCFTVERIALVPVGNPIAPILNPFQTYHNLMNPNSPSACGYHWKHPPCEGGSKKAFWDAICLAIVQQPPSPQEAQYIDQNFAVFGIHSTGCSNVDYDALNLGWDDGVAGVKWAETHLSVVSSEASNEWQATRFNGVWPINPLDILRRANNGFMVPNEINVYWIAFYESRGTKDRLTGANGNTYRVDWRDIVPVDYSKFGFWSLTVYDETWYLVGPNSRTFGVRGNTAVVPPSFLLSADCTGRSNCVLIPNGPFQLIIRGYNPTAGLEPGTTYEFPKVKLCKSNGNRRGNDECSN